MDFGWDELIECIDENRVMPVIGQELLVGEIDGRQHSLQRVLAERLADKLQMKIEINQFSELNDFVCAYLEQPRTKPADLYPLIAKVTKEMMSQVPIPEPLLKLARIRKFDYFVTLTFDSLMARAVDRVRFHGEPGTREIAFSINQSTARQSEAMQKPPAGLPVVFSLFGRASSSADYAIHDEDVLEFVHRLVSGDVTPPDWLLTELRTRHLLIIGAHLPDWLGRFVLRAATRGRLMVAQRSYFIAREGAATARALDEFLRRFGRETRIHVFDGTAGEFVDELERRWHERFGSEDPMTTPDPKPARAAADGSIFISYGRENLAEVETLHHAIEELGGDAWFDKDELTVGERWEKTILAKIQRDVRLFIPVLSARTVQRAEREGEAYVFKEWNRAFNRAEMIVGRKFIFPVIVDSDFDGSLDRYRVLLDAFPSLAESGFGHAPSGVPTARLSADLVSQIRTMRREAVR